MGGSGKTLDIDATGTLSIDSATGINIGVTADKPIDIDASTLSIDTSDNANITVGGSGKTLDIDASGTLSIDSATGINIGVTADKPIDIDASTLSIDTSDNANITVGGSGKTLDIDATGTLSIDSATRIDIGVTADKPIDIDASTLSIDTSDNANITVGGSGKTLDIDATGTLSIDSATGIDIGVTADKPIDIDASTLSIDTSDNANITVGGSGKTLDIDATGTLSIDSATGINIGVTSDKPIDIDASIL